METSRGNVNSHQTTDDYRRRWYKTYEGTDKEEEEKEKDTERDEADMRPVGRSVLSQCLHTPKKAVAVPYNFTQQQSACLFMGRTKKGEMREKKKGSGERGGEREGGRQGEKGIGRGRVQQIKRR